MSANPCLLMKNLFLIPRLLLSCIGPFSEAKGENALSLGGQGASKGGRQSVGVAGTVGKKKSTKGPQAASGSDQKDPDGSIRLPGYRGVWVNQAGKHFVKIDGVRFAGQDTKTIYFDSVDEAAKKHDVILKERKPAGKNELNFKADGTRIVYEDVTTSSTTGIGGSASSVVPALSVINIKVSKEEWTSTCCLLCVQLTTIIFRTCHPG